MQAPMPWAQSSNATPTSSPRHRISANGSPLGAEAADQFADLPNGIRLCYRIDGPADGEPLLLLAGLGLDLTFWPRPFIDGLAEAGFRVIRHDNRDIGRSSRIASPPPSQWRLIAAHPRRDAYSLYDMAEDSIGLLDQLGIDTAHVIGMSMGGMIAQTIAAWWPHRVDTLTSMISTTGHPKVGQATWATKRRLLTPAAKTREQSVRRHVEMMHHLSGTRFRPDDELEIRYAQTFWDRAELAEDTSAAGTMRQVQAIQASADRTPQLRQVTAATLVIHGDRDPIVNPNGGIATANAIAGAHLITIPGMGHHLAPGVLDRLVELITDHTQPHTKGEDR